MKFSGFQPKVVLSFGFVGPVEPVIEKCWLDASSLSLSWLVKTMVHEKKE